MMQHDKGNIGQLGATGILAISNEMEETGVM
jgi:hypothetical protein